MRTFFPIFLLLVAFIAATVSACRDGETWKEDCNNCWCANGSRACTRMMCESTVLSEDKPTNGSGCTPGTSWREDCKQCVCTKNGTPSCSRNLCKGQGIKVQIPPVREERSVQDTCQDGETWMEDCNNCVCINGLKACTEMLCPPKVPEEYTATNGSGCTPGTSWREDCKQCICTKDGTPSCSRNLCKGQGIKVQIPPVREERSVEDTCQDGETWNEDCNNCWCVNGLKACTRKMCPKNVPDEYRTNQCFEGDVWMKDCNRCTCVRGMERCTRKACRSSRSPAARSSPSWN